jgi:hypothetical protein
LVCGLLFFRGAYPGFVLSDVPIGKTPTGGKQVGWFCVGANDKGTKPGYAFFLKTAEEKPLLPLDFRGAAGR